MKILIVAPSTRAIAESARQAKYDFATVDYFGDTDQKKICKNYSLRENRVDFSIENLFRFSLRFRGKYSHLVYGSGFENHPELLEEYQKYFSLLGNPPEVVKRVRDWKKVIKIMKKLDIAFPRTFIVESDEINDISGNYVIKPIKTGGGKGIYKMGEHPPLAGKFLVQEYIKGKNVSAMVLGCEGEYFFIGGTEQLLDKFLYLGNISPFEHEELQEASIKIAEAFKLVGINGIDFILADKLYAIEINPRLTGALEVIERAYHLNIFDLHVKACLGEKIFLKRKISKNFFARKIVYAKHTIKVKGKFPSFIKDVPEEGEIIKRGSPVCTILAQGITREDCMNDLKKKEEILNAYLWKEDI